MWNPQSSFTWKLLGGMQMSNCPICRMPMKKETSEIQKGIFAQVESCHKCKDEWIDEKGYEALSEMFTRQAFEIDGEWIDEKEHDRLVFEDNEAREHREALEFAADIRMSRGDPADPEDYVEVNEETKRDIEEALAEFKAGKYYTHEEVKRELGLGKKKVK